MAKDPYKNSPYDASGMPLAADTVDYDNKGEVAQKMVKDLYEPPLPLFTDDGDYREPKIKTRTHYNPALNNTAIQTPGHKIHKAHEEDIGTGIPSPEDKPLDLDNPETSEQLALEDPKQTNKTELESDKVDHSELTETEKEADKNAEESRPDPDFLKALESTESEDK